MSKLTEMTKSADKIPLHVVLLLTATTVCVLIVGGTVATITAVVYATMLTVGLLGIFANIFTPKSTGMQIGFVRKPGKSVSVDINLYDNYIYLYDHRMSSIWFWLSLPLALAWPVVFLSGGFTKIACTSFAALILSEIGKYRVYRSIKKNKTGWGAAAYISEIHSFFNEKKKE